MMTREEAQKLAQKILAMSTFEECQVSISSQEQAYTRFANNGITTSALVNLGYARPVAQKAIETAIEKNPAAAGDFETLFRAAMAAIR